MIAWSLSGKTKSIRLVIGNRHQYVLFKTLCYFDGWKLFLNGSEHLHKRIASIHHT